MSPISPRTSPWDEDHDDDASVSSTNASRRAQLTMFALFLINFVGSMAICLNMIVGIATFFDPQKLQINLQIALSLLVGVLCMIPSAGPFGAYAFVEWRAWHDGNAALVRKLGYCNLVAATLAVLFLIVEFGEALIERVPSLSMIWFALAIVATAVYLVGCGLFRIRMPLSTANTIGPPVGNPASTSQPSGRV